MTAAESTADQPMKQLITMRLGAAGFAQHWKHCDLVANYLATFTSELLHKTDSHANLVSTVLNELLEVVFRRNAEQGEIGITLKGDATQIVVEISVPVREGDHQFYQEMAELVQRADRDDLHRQHLEKDADDEQDLALSLLELAASYEAVLEVKDSTQDNMLLLELPFRVES